MRVVISQQSNAESVTLEANSKEELDRKVNAAMAGRRVYHTSSHIGCHDGAVVYIANLILEKRSKRQQLLEG